MKKLALTSLFALCAVYSANASNVINGNPLYMPAEGHFYSITSVGSDTKYLDTWGVNESLGYGITDRLTMFMSTNMFEKDTFDNSSWDDFSVGLLYRAFEDCGWTTDVYGSYNLDAVWADHEAFLDKDFTYYNWNLGVREGYSTSNWNVSGYIEFSYLTGGKVIGYDLTDSESFNWGDDGMHVLTIGASAQYLLSDKWNLVADLAYQGVLDDDWYDTDYEVKDAGEWYGKLGVNYNIDETKFVGAFVSETMNHSDGWTSDKGFGFGAKFGVDF